MDTSFVFTQSVDPPDDFSKILPFVTLAIGSILTLLVTLLIQKINTKSNRKKTKNYLIHSLETLLLSIDKQQTRTQEHISNLEQKPNNFPALIHVAGFNVKNINIISPKEMYDIFGTNKNNEKTTKAFHTLTNTLEAFETNKDLLYKNDSDIGNDNREYIKKHNNLFSQIMAVMRRDVHSLENSSTIVEFVTKSNTTIVREELGTLLNEFYKDGLENKSLFDLYDKVILRAYTTSMDYKDEELSILLLDSYLVLFNFVNDRNQYLDSLKKRYESFQDLERKLRDSLKYLKEEI